MYTQNVETIEPFSSCIVLVRAGRAYLAEYINVMVQALQTQDGSLPQGLTVQNTYPKLTKGSKKAVVVVRNSMAYWQTLQKKSPVAKAVAASPVPRLTVRQRHGKLFGELDLSSLDSWTPELADSACKLLAEYHDMFSLDPAELGCTHSMEHTIKVTDDTTFKEQFK